MGGGVGRGGRKWGKEGGLEGRFEGGFGQVQRSQRIFGKVGSRAIQVSPS